MKLVLQMAGSDDREGRVISTSAGVVLQFAGPSSELIFKASVATATHQCSPKVTELPYVLVIAAVKTFLACFQSRVYNKPGRDTFARSGTHLQWCSLKHSLT